MLAGALALVGNVVTALAQAPVIASLARNGELVCTNLLAGSTASVVWASAVLGPWTNGWPGLEAQVADSNGMIRARLLLPADSGPVFFRIQGFSAPTNFAYVPPGTFTMGSPTNEFARYPYEGPQTRVTLSHGFWMGKFEVTQGEYLAVIGENPSSFPGDLGCPVESVTWTQAVSYCATLTMREQAD